MAQFETLEAEFLLLEAKGESTRDDEEHERWEDLARLLFRD